MRIADALVVIWFGSNIFSRWNLRLCRGLLVASINAPHVLKSVKTCQSYWQKFTGTFFINESVRAVSFLRCVYCRRFRPRSMVRRQWKCWRRHCSDPSR